MKENLESSLRKTEKTIELYKRFMEDNQDDWSEKEIDVAKKTFKNLVSFYNQIQRQINVRIDYTEPEKEYILYCLEKIDKACQSILEHLEELY
jgi:hypothetical protein